MEWKPINTAPKDDQVIDLWHKEYGRMTNAWWVDDDECWSATGSSEGFTHWMPIPEPPK